MNELALFAGVGGGILGGELLGWRTVCAVERDAYAAGVLAQRQNDGCLPPFPIWSDITTFDGRPWKGIVDVVSGGFPCQDISVAGKGAGIKGERSGLWSEMFRIIREVRPKFVFVENSPALTSRGLGKVLGDLAQIRYDAEWGVLGAWQVGAPHKGDRIWILASPTCIRWPSNEEIQKRTHAQNKLRCNGEWPSIQDAQKDWLLANSFVSRSFDAFPNWMDRIKAIGNAQVPAVAAVAFQRLMERIQNGSCIEN